MLLVVIRLDAMRETRRNLLKLQVASSFSHRIKSSEYFFQSACKIYRASHVLYLHDLHAFYSDKVLSSYDFKVFSRKGHCCQYSLIAFAPDSMFRNCTHLHNLTTQPTNTV